MFYINNTYNREINMCIAEQEKLLFNEWRALRPDLVKDGVVDFFRDTKVERPSVETNRPDIRLHRYISRNEAILSIDLAGVSLHKRCFRIHGGEAPL